jgi:hypothetical protein
LLDKLFVIVETVALRWARPGRAVVELELLAKRRDPSCASVRSASKQHPAVQHRVCGQERKSKQKRRIICVDFREPVTVNAILSRAQSCREGHFRAMRGNIESFLDSVRMRNCLTRLYLDVSCCLVQSQCILLLFHILPNLSSVSVDVLSFSARSTQSKHERDITWHGIERQVENPERKFASSLHDQR